MTWGREETLDVLSQAEEKLNAEDIYMMVHQIYPNIGLTSIYRTLDILTNTEEGLSKKYDFTITNHLIQFYSLCHSYNERK